MKKDRTNAPSVRLVVYICVQVMISVDAGTGTALEFTKRLEGQCFRKIYSISVGDCLKECKQRPKCGSVSYHRRKLMCELNEFDGANDHSVSDHQPGFVYAKKEPLQDNLVCGSDVCTLNQKCDENTSSCVVKECTSINTPSLGYIFGNIMSVGSKLSLVCEEGFTIKTGNDYHVTLTSKCLDEGRWSYEEFECVPTTCKVRKQMTPTLVSGLFEFTDTETKEKVNIFCDFDDGYGHTFVSKQDFGKLSNIAVHYTRTDYVILRHIRQDLGQRETRVAVLPAYGLRYNVTVLLNSNEDFSSPRQKDTNGPFMLLGFVPNSFGPKKFTTQGYACNGEDVSYNNCDENKNNYFVVYSGSNDNDLNQHAGNQFISFGWATLGIEGIAEERNLPVDFFGLFEMGMGGCGGFISHDIQRGPETVTGVAVGIRFDY